MTDSAFERMRLFYNLFPYPGRPLWQLPHMSSGLLAHGGFHRLCAGADQTRCARIWRAGIFGCSHSETLAMREELAHEFWGERRVLLVGCGTDEPVLFRRLHPEAEITGLDLSARSLARARWKLRLAAMLTSGRASVRLVQVEGTEFLAQEKASAFDFIQCFGVLHHQPDPIHLFRRMAAALKPGGVLRLMVYSNNGRQVERWVQRRAARLWHGSQVRFRLGLRAMALSGWQLGNFLCKPRTRGRRFRYLGLHAPWLADALLHPSDPGLAPAMLGKWAQETGLRMVFCESRCAQRDWIVGFGDGAGAAWDEILAAEKEGSLVRNVVVSFVREGV